MKSPADEVIVVIGGSSGIGKAAAKLIAAQGAEVVLMARGTARLQAAAEEIRQQGGKVHILSSDVASPTDVQKAAAAVEQQFGKVDSLIFGAGLFYLSPVETMDLARAKLLMEINYWGAIHTTQAFLPLIRKGRRKSLIYISSLSAYCTPPFFTAYAASKHALRGFVLALRQELRPEGIHVGMVSPGPIYTPLIEQELHQDMYRLPFGIPVLTPETAAEYILKFLLHPRRRERVVPTKMTWAARLGGAFHGFVEKYYRFSIPGWNKLILSQTTRSPAYGEDQMTDSLEENV